MTDDERIWTVVRVIDEYVRSPSLRHIRHPDQLRKVAAEIVKHLDRGANPMWSKWDSNRDAVAHAAVGCWVPNEDLRDFLNSMPGPRLTTTDVARRLKHLEEVEYVGSSEKELQVNCLAVYERETDRRLCGGVAASG